jgi:high-affinity Fe2+/Pb2+ permease
LDKDVTDIKDIKKVTDIFDNIFSRYGVIMKSIVEKWPKKPQSTKQQGEVKSAKKLTKNKK